MRLIHFADLNDGVHVEPRCGPWGSMDADWTDLPGDATCLGCRTAMTPRDWEKAGALAPVAGGGAS